MIGTESITVCLASFNGVLHIGDQIKSILSAPEVDELIISDDGSTDGTLEYVKSISDPRIRLLIGPSKGLIRNFENALIASSGDIIFLADQDDIWMESKVRKMVRALKSVDLVVCDAQVVNDSMDVLHPSFFFINGSRGGFFRNLFKCGYLGNCVAMRRSLLPIILPFPDDLPMHDWWIGLNAEVHGRVSFIGEQLVKYRRHQSNASSASGISTTTLFKKLMWRAAIFRAVMMRFLRVRLLKARGIN